MIPYGRQNIDQSDIDAVVSVLHSNYLTQGPVVPVFEKAISNYCGAKYAVAVNSATSALHIACLALGVGKSDIVWVTPTSFVASANCAIYCGATVDFVDIDPRTYNLCAVRLAEKLELASKLGKLPKVLIPVHLCGQPCDMLAIYELSQQYGFKIIEDASHAIGSRYKNEPIGNCHYSDIAIFSFHPVKIITTGEGGIAVTNNDSLAKQLRLLRSHGITSAPDDMDARPPKEIWNYQQIDLGFNYRMTDIQAALGLSQLHKLDEFVNRRQAIARRYDQMLSTLPVITPYQRPDSYSAYHLYVVCLCLDKINKTQKEVYNELHLADIFVNLHYIPIYRQPYYEKMGFVAGYCPRAEKYYSEAITIPIYPGMSDLQQNYVVEKLKSALQG